MVAALQTSMMLDLMHSRMAQLRKLYHRTLIAYYCAPNEQAISPKSGYRLFNQ